MTGRFLIKGIPILLRRRYKRLRSLIRISNAGEIARRYFVINAFDGALTILGIIVGTLVSGHLDPAFVISAGLGASFAMGVSGVVGAFMAEAAERARALKELEGHMFRSLKGTVLDQASRTATIWIALIDGISPVVAAVIPLIPMVAALKHAVPIDIAIISSVGLDLITLFVLGIFLGKVSERNVWKSGLVMVSAGITIALGLWFLSKLFS